RDALHSQHHPVMGSPTVASGLVSNDSLRAVPSCRLFPVSRFLDRVGTPPRLVPSGWKLWIENWKINPMLPPNYRIRPLAPADYAAITDICRPVYPAETPYTREELDDHRQVFPQGQFIAADHHTDNVAGVHFTLRLFLADFHVDDPWDILTAGG